MFSYQFGVCIMMELLLIVFLCGHRNGIGHCMKSSCIRVQKVLLPLELLELFFSARQCNHLNNKEERRAAVVNAVWK